MRRFKSSIFLFGLLFLSLGFRTYLDSNKWDGVSNSTASTRKIFIDFSQTTTAVTNDLASPDSLSGAGPTVTVAQLMQSIFDDYNDIDGAYINLVDITDADYTAGNNRTITVSFAGASGMNAGEASLVYENGKITGCTIESSEDLLDSAHEFVRTMAHEIGHCLGLDHPQETVNSIMSYFRRSEDIRLLIDDKMGIIYLFPTDESAAKEKSTYGLSCAKG
jgi:hypothetical protein